MSNATYPLWAILAMGVATLLVRLLPFYLLGRLRDHPLLAWMGEELPPLAMPILVIFCLRGVEWTKPPYGTPEIISIALIIALHIWKRNMLLSLALGMGAYLSLNYFT